MDEVTVYWGVHPPCSLDRSKLMGYPAISYPEPKKSIQNMIKIKSYNPKKLCKI